MARGLGCVLQRKDGNWCASLQVNGLRRVVYAKSEREAKLKLIDLHIELGSGQARQSCKSRYSVASWFEFWLQAVRPGLKPRTIADYEHMYRRHIGPELGKVRLNSLTPDRIQALYISMQSRGLKRVPLQVHVLLHQALGFAQKMGLVVNNPCDRVIRPMYRPTRKQIWALPELHRFLEETCGHRFHGLWYLAASSGCRIGELLGLRWINVDLSAGTIAVVGNLQLINGNWVESTPKTAAGERTVVLPKPAVAILVELHQTQALRHGGTDTRWRDLVFTTEKGEPICCVDVAHQMAKECRRLGLPHLTPHGLRHMHASLLLAGGLPVPAVSARLGHANPNITMTVYAHLVRNQDATAAAIAESVLG